MKSKRQRKICIICDEPSSTPVCGECSKLSDAQVHAVLDKQARREAVKVGPSCISIGCLGIALFLLISLIVGLFRQFPWF